MKKIFLVLALVAFGGFFIAPVTKSAFAKNEGKIDKEIDLPIEKPKIKDIEEEEEDDGPEFYGEDLGGDGDTLVFVVDFSCSMYGSRIAKAKKEVNKAINSLTKNFKFSVVTYTCYTKTWKGKLVDATPENKGAATGWINGQSPSGATGTGLAVKTALKIDKENKLVVLLTDGAPNCLGSGYGSSSDHLNMILNSNSQGAKVNVFAINPWSGSYKQFCQDIAQKTGGKYKEVN